MLSGPKLIDDKEFRDALLLSYPNAKGGEMEGEGGYAAAEKSRIQTILIKSICDWADGHKNDRAQAFAAFTSASLAAHVLNQPDVLGVLGATDVQVAPRTPKE
jgi:nucleoside phosphorylase